MAGTGVTVATDGPSAHRKAAIWGNLSPKVFLHSNLISICTAGGLCHHTQSAELAVARV